MKSNPVFDYSKRMLKKNVTSRYKTDKDVFFLGWLYLFRPFSTFFTQNE